MPIPIVLLISLFHFSIIPAQPYVKFIPDKDQVKEVVLENNSYRYTIAIGNAVKLTSMLDKSTGYDYMKNNEDLIFTSSPHPWALDHVGFQLFNVEEFTKDGRKGVSIRQQSSYVENS